MDIYVKSEVVLRARDGGTEVYRGWDGNSYYVDYRIASKTRGQVYNAYPGDKDAILLRRPLDSYQCISQY